MLLIWMRILQLVGDLLLLILVKQTYLLSEYMINSVKILLPQYASESQGLIPKKIFLESLSDFTYIDLVLYPTFHNVRKEPNQ